jgi:uncharacterized membrane protein
MQIGLYNMSSWRATTYVMLALSLGVFLIQRTSYAAFDLVFEVCIFHIPALVCAVIYLRILGQSTS